MIKVGLIGAGYMGSTHASCYLKLIDNEDVKVTAVADVRRKYAEKTAESLGAEAFSSGEDLIQNADIDAVDICLPTYLHARYAIAAMNAKKHVLLEKPACLTRQEGEELLRVQKETGVKVMVAQCLRFWPEYTWLKKIILDGSYGEVRSAVFKRLSPKPGWAWEDWFSDPNKSGSVALDLHIHDVDICRYLWGEPDKVVSLAGRDDHGIIQHVASTYMFGKTMVSIEACMNYPEKFPFSMSYRCDFDEAAVIYDSSKNEAPIIYKKDGSIDHVDLVKELGKGDRKEEPEGLEAYYSELKYFIRGVKGENEFSISSMKDGITSVDLVLQEVDVAGGLINKQE